MILLAAPGASASFDPSTASVAIVGFLGVLAGGILTLVGQAVSRRAARIQASLDRVVELVSSSHAVETEMNSLRLIRAVPSTPQSVVEGVMDRINDANDSIAQLANLLSVQATGAIRERAVHLCTATIDAGGYFHPVLGDGAAEDYELGEAYLGRIFDERNYLVQVARVHGIRRLRVVREVKKERSESIKNFDLAVKAAAPKP